MSSFTDSPGTCSRSLRRQKKAEKGWKRSGDVDLQGCMAPLQNEIGLKLFKSNFKNGPDLPFLAFLDFLAFFVARNFLAFLSVFPFFPKDFRGSA